MRREESWTRHGFAQHCHVFLLVLLFNVAFISFIPCIPTWPFFIPQQQMWKQNYLLSCKPKNFFFPHLHNLYPNNRSQKHPSQKHPSKQVLNSSKNPILHEFSWHWDRAVVVGKWCVLWAAQICSMPWSRNGCSVSDLLAKRILYFLNSHGDGLISIATGFSLLPFPLTGRNTLTSWKC